MEQGEEFSLTQNAGVVGLSKFVSVLGLLAASVVLTRVLSRTDYGNYEQVWLVYNSFLPLVAYGLSSSIYYFSAREDRKKVYSSAALWVTVIGILTGIFLFVFAQTIAALFNSNVLTGYIRIFAVYAAVSSPSLMFESVFVTEKRVGLLLAGNILVSVLLAGMVFISAIIFHSLSIVFWSVAIVGAVKSAFLLVYLFKEEKLTSRKLSPAVKSQLLYAAPIFASSVIGTFSRQVDRYLVTLFFSPDQFAIYAVGAREIPMIAVLTGSASAVLLPMFSELGSKEMHGKFVSTWRNSISKTGLFLLPMMVFLFFAAKDFMVFFFGEKYVASSGVFRIFLLLLPLRLAYYSPALFMLGKQKLYMYSSAVELFLSAGVSYFLMRTYGLEGAAVGKVVVTYFEAAFLIAVLVVLLRTNFKDFFPWINILKILAVSAISMIPVFFAWQYVENIYARFVAEAGIFFIVFAAISVLTRLVRIIDLKKLRFVVT
ncbi:MAG: oligosaccharide flippase family protein [Candidatus Kryptoniota bacterium]